MIHEEHYWQSSDGTQLYWQEWRPAERPCAVILLVHGLGEHSGRYKHVADVFIRSGFAILAFDQRGHGHSQGIRGDEVSFDTTANDIDHFLAEARTRFPHVPLFLYGHSLGGLLVLYYSLAKKPKISGVISTAPPLTASERVPPAKRMLGKLLARLAPATQLDNGLDRSGLARIPKVINEYNTDPLVHGKVSARFGLDLLLKGKWVLDHTSFPLPLLLMAGSEDRIIDPEAVRQFGASLEGNVTTKLFPGLYHEVHNEPEQAEVLGEMQHWIEKNIG